MVRTHVVPEESGHTPDGVDFLAADDFASLVRD